MHLLFDLDGTLTDSFPGITRCYQHALASLGRGVPTAEELRWCIGPGAQENFAVLLETRDQELIAKALAHYRERFSSVGLFENEVYPGIDAALTGLRRMGVTLGVATAKPTVFARRIMDHFGLAKHFRSVDGSELDGTRRDKGDLIAHILRRDGLPASDVIMVGDRALDIQGARQNGLVGIGVLWGYGSREELEAAGAVACVASAAELATVVEKHFPEAEEVSA